MNLKIREKNRTIIGLVIALLGLTTMTVSAEREVVDQIVVVIADKVILASEVASRMQMIALQSGRQPETEAAMVALQKRVLDDMISDRLFQVEAAKDTTLSIRPEEINQALDDHINRISQNFPSEEAFYQALASEGLTLRDLRKQFRSEVHNQLLKNRMIAKKVRDVQVSRHEVEAFYDEFRDSIPEQPEGLKLAHILLSFNPSAQVEDSVRAIAAGLRRQVLDGADFATISARHSTAGAGANGGDLGYLAREDLVPEFARAAFKLQPGDMSGVVRTQFGYHVIMCTDTRDDELRLSHILLAVDPSAADTVLAFRLADSLLTQANEGTPFAELAKAFSVDDESRAQGGELGWFAVGDIPPEFSGELDDWNEVGSFRGPIKTRFGLHVMHLLDYQKSKTFTIEEDYDRIKEMTKQSKTEETITEWIAEIRSHTYIDMRLESL